ncbi:target of Nesh-SH3-like isoform X2 [Brienomyrus brachyistius]|uniref:target of Nesh-SH3-like isoform X2 n=1 Tax=Brienomyrus brachyistius TaxID=42636 RepID=UPI0020B44CD8|nr:target of Nesh-SH3-like isoform X2 [Brienomyrus brachyistius]
MLLGLPVDITPQSLVIRSAPERDPASLKCPAPRVSEGTMLPRPLFLLLAGILLISFSHAQQIRVRRQNMKVRINATGDTIVLKFVRPSPDMKLEGYILGYGSTMFSRQFIELPRDGEPYESEMDAEPKYLIAVQPIPTNAVKKQCSGKINLDKPLHLVIGTVSPTSVLLSWGTLLKTPYEGSTMSDCLEDGYYTVRYRERNRKWNYQTCPSSNTVIDNLKPNTPYEFGVRPSKNERMGTWSKSVLHNTGVDDKVVLKPFKPRVPNGKPVKPVTGTHEHLSPNGLQNRTQHTETAPVRNGFPNTPKAPYAPPSGRLETSPIPRTTVPHWVELTPGRASSVTNVSQQSGGAPPTTNLLRTSTAHVPTPFPNHQGRAQPRVPRPSRKFYSPSAVGESWEGLSLLTSTPTYEPPHDDGWGTNAQRNMTSSTALVPQSSAVTMAARNLTTSPDSAVLSSASNNMRQHFPPRSTNSSQTVMTHGANNSLEDIKPGVRDGIGQSRPSSGDPRYGSSSQSNTVSGNKKINQVGKPGDKGKATDLKQTDMSPFPKPNLPPATPKPTKQERRMTTPVAPASNGSQFDIRDNSPVFSNRPISEVDALGKKRFVAPHVIYKTDKKQDEPCSITTSLSYFPDEDGGEQNVTGPPKMAPSNLTVVTVEGCPSFIILDWDKTDNETTEYEVISTTKGPEGEEVSILTTNQTHTAVENLRPERSYEFKVKPKNELGEGPATEPVSFNTESADPRVTENVSGKDAIWTQFPFKSDSYSECNGKQYVKRTWYRKFVGIQLCNSLRYKIYLSDSLNGKFYNIGDQTGHGEDHCQFVDSFLDGRTGSQLLADQLPPRPGYYRAVRQEPVHFGQIGGNSHISYVAWYECGAPIPGKW